jgi:hypothetical protein
MGEFDRGIFDHDAQFEDWQPFQSASQQAGL